MNESNIEYPTLSLGGVDYIVKFTRGAMIYRVAKSGANFAHLYGADPAKRLAAVIDCLHAALFEQFTGTPDQLAELVIGENKIAEATTALLMTMGKVFPPTQAAAAAEGEKPQAALPN